MLVAGAAVECPTPGLEEVLAPKNYILTKHFIRNKPFYRNIHLSCETNHYSFCSRTFDASEQIQKFCPQNLHAKGALQ